MSLDERVSRSQAAVLGALAFLAALIVGIGALSVPEPRWSAEATARVVPQPSAPGTNAYGYDVLSRRTVLPTLAKVLENRRFQLEAAERLGVDPGFLSSVRVQGHSSPTSSVITLSVTGNRREPTQKMATATLEQGVRFVNSLERLYVLRPLPVSSHLRPAESNRLSKQVAVVLMAMLVATSAYVLATRYGRRRIPPAIASDDGGVGELSSGRPTGGGAATAARGAC